MTNKKMVVLDILKRFSPLTIPQILQRFEKREPELKISKSEIRLILWRELQKENNFLRKEEFSGNRVTTRYSIDFEALPENELKSIDFQLLKKLILLMGKARISSSSYLEENDFNELEAKRIKKLMNIVKKDMM